MHKRKQQILTVTIFVALIVFMLGAILLLPSLTESTLENRTLAQKPSLPAEDTTLKDYFREWDQYLADQVPFRDIWVRTYYYLQIRVLGKSRLNGMAIGSDGYLLPIDEYPRKSREATLQMVDTTIDFWNDLQEETAAYGGHTLFSLIPGRSSFERDRFPADLEYPPQRDVDDAEFKAALQGSQLDTLDLGPLFEERRGQQLFYKTDHHWTFEGAYLTYAAIMGALGLPPLDPDDLDYLDMPNPFNGSYNRRIGSVLNTDDRFSIGFVKNETPFDLTVDGEPKEPARLYMFPLNDPSKSVGYENYWYNFKREVVLDTHREDLPDLLVIGDSYRSALVPLLKESFNVTRTIDLRFYEDVSPLDDVALYTPDYVVFLARGYSCLRWPWNFYAKQSDSVEGEE